MDRDYRRERVKALPARALKRTVLADLDREYTLSEIVTITSAGPARALGLRDKGHLGVGADADVAIYREERDGVALFKSPRCVIKGGEVVVEEGQIRTVVQGREFVVRPAFDAGIEDYLRPVFQQLYTISFDNYPVEAERVHGMQLAEGRPGS
jgi:formylmethanofuran dehydrogenase subunit A